MKNGKKKTIVARMTQEEKKAKKREYDIVYRAANRARLKRQNAERYADDRENQRALRRADYYAKKEEYLARQKKNGPAYRAAHKEETLFQQRAYRAANKERLKNRDEEYRLATAEARQNYGKTYYRKNKSAILKKARGYEKNRYRENENYRLRKNLAMRITNALAKGIKSAKTLALLGCSIEFLRQYLENQFLPGMNWCNYKKTGWHVDHIKPCAKFDLTNPAQQLECFHYTNLQPLWAVDNLRKSDSYGS